MAKKKKTDADFLAEIAEASGGETLEEAGRVPYWIDSGNLSLNWVCSGKFIGGGFPGGKIIEAYGAEASGKSLMGYCFLGSVQRMGGVAIWLDCERSANADFASRCGHVDPSMLPVFYPIALEDCEKKIIQVVEAIREQYPDKVIGIVWDSISVNPSKREQREIELPENPTAAQIKEIGGLERPGERARISNGLLRKLNPFLNDHGATLYVVNQLRKKIGVVYGSDEVTPGGGEALKYDASVRLRMGAPKSFVNKDTKFPLGVNMKFKNKKNRHFTPGLDTEDVPLFFDNGLHPLGGLLKTLVFAGRVVGKSTYTVQEPWAGGEEIKFRASLAKPMEPDVLRQCPALVDAKSADEVDAYLAEWQQAMSALDGAEEVDKTDEVDHLLGDDVKKGS
jgi:recombination protein RecA